MGEALMLVNFLTAALQAGLNISLVLAQVSDRLKKVHATGGTLMPEDLTELLNQGDTQQQAAHALFAKILADPATPRA